MCVVVDGRRVPFGALSLEAMVADPNAAAEELMEPGPPHYPPQLDVRGCVGISEAAESGSSPGHDLRVYS